eukprot:TRINITY_DN37077_c0_g1_i2.p1 TRINITY_DN37077_c0_g1~~TRINITY_DN37077_c0_g1_i2.p1  ORF type:complete len:348 (-),score=72.42 TRINITY_DN37077_c0_g1_i2:90-1133(-)
MDQSRISLACEGALVAINSARMRSTWDKIATLLQGIVELPSEPVSNLDPRYKNGSTALIVVPAETADHRVYTSNRTPISPMTIQLLRKYGYVDGLCVTVPSVDVTLRHTEPLNLHLRVVTVLCEGLVPALLCRHYLNFQVASASQFIGAMSKGELPVTESRERQLLDAVTSVAQMEQTKAFNTFGASLRNATLRIALTAGELRSRGRVSDDQVATWLRLYANDLGAPLWEVHVSFSEPNGFFGTVKPILNRPGLGMKTVEKLEEALASVDANAVDFHRIGLSQCTILLSLSSFCLKEAVDVLLGLFKFKPRSLGPVHTCLLYTSDAADEEDSGGLCGRRIIKKKKKK